MDSIEIEEINFELKKINAIKIKNKKTKGSEDEKNTDEGSIQSRLNVDIRQSDDMNVLEVFIYYRIPSVQDFELDIDAEFYASIILKEPFNIDTLSEEDELEKEKFDDFSATFMPKLLKETDKALLPIFKSMSVKFFPLASKSS